MKKKFKRILIINPYGIGDVLFTTPVIRNLKEEFPDARIAYICNSRVRPFLRQDKFLDEVIAFEKEEMVKILKRSKIDFFKKGWAFISSIRKKRFDLVIDYSLNFQFSMFTVFAGIKTRIGLDRKRRSRFLTKRIPLEGFSDKHVVDYYLSVLELIGIQPKRFPLELNMRKEDLDAASDILRMKGINPGKDFCVAICPGGGQSWGEQADRKHWPAVKFAELADQIIKELGVKVMIFAGLKEDSIGNKVSNFMKEKALNFSGKTSLVEFLSLLSKCKLLIANDGGPLHIAAALGLNVVSIFGPVDEKVYGPYPDQAKHLVIKKDISCRPCYKNFRLADCLHDKECLISISIEEVFDKVKTFYKDKG
ncbi:MAG: lipopolysaccharide heptosyltransferase II [Candidatus Methanomethylicota archaeon]|uniref:lipopolysaccharide heptosyltransferase II n=1 Tax=Thermoproteota archaeon TaxID=2056631 RepID=A0A497EKT1_9CREN|nr:MAG: lipopolysaccharide heptosyltransferase II [Candidatus Verstraetearchaeota archaeon]